MKHTHWLVARKETVSVDVQMVGFAGKSMDTKAEECREYFGLGIVIRLCDLKK